MTTCSCPLTRARTKSPPPFFSAFIRVGKTDLIPDGWRENGACNCAISQADYRADLFLPGEPQMSSFTRTPLALNEAIAESGTLPSEPISPQPYHCKLSRAADHSIHRLDELTPQAFKLRTIPA